MGTIKFTCALSDTIIAKRKDYQEHLYILCVMDTGDGAGFVYRTGHSEMFIPMLIVGHWLKKAWGYYYKLSKMKYIPRIPGM
jgi:sulfide:quinone oxidoreductase